MSKLALLGGDPAVRKPIPDWPQYDAAEKKALSTVLQSRHWWRGTGSAVLRFEAEFAGFLDVPKVLAVTNGTAALELALRVAGIGAGDEVVVPAMTFISTASAVFMCGAIPVAVDVDPATWCLSPQAVRAAISPRTRAIVPVHFAGNIAKIDELVDIAREHRLILIEDAAHAHGAKFRGKFAGSFGDYAIFSFQNFKLMTSGEGGAVVFRRPDEYATAYTMANCGRPDRDTRYRHTVLGANLRLGEFQAAILSCQLKRLAAQNEIRQRNARAIHDQLRGAGFLHLQQTGEGAEIHSNYMFVFTLDEACWSGVSREAVVKALIAEGLPAYRMYPRVQDTEFYAGCLQKAGAQNRPECPHSLRQSRLGIWLHHRVLLGGPQENAAVVNALQKVYEHRAELRESEAHEAPRPREVPDATPAGASAAR